MVGIIKVLLLPQQKSTSFPGLFPIEIGSPGNEFEEKLHRLVFVSFYIECAFIILRGL